jgi:hypothetical protein
MYDGSHCKCTNTAFLSNAINDQNQRRPNAHRNEEGEARREGKGRRGVGEERKKQSGTSTGPELAKCYFRLLTTIRQSPIPPRPAVTLRGPTCDPLRGPRPLSPAPLGAKYYPPGAAAVAATTAHDPLARIMMPRMRPTRSARSTGRRILPCQRPASHLKPRTVARAPGPVADGAG